MHFRYSQSTQGGTTLRNQGSKGFRRGLAVGALAGGVLLAQSAFAQSPPPFGPPVGPGRALALGDMTNAKPLIPSDIYRTNNTVAHADLATFAWLEFFSAVAPNVGGNQRGVPGGSFASTGTPGAGPLVWETYQHRTELLPCNMSNGNGTPVPPQPWGAPPKYVVAAGNACTTITTPGGFNNLDETSEIGQNYLFFPQTPGSPNPANDAQVLFEAKVNQYESQFVLQNYKGFKPLFGPFHFSPPITLPTGTVEVKAAWRPLSSIPPSQWYRYHIAHVLVYSGDPPTPASQPYALVALHIIHKTANYPTFIFATFEQVDDYQNQATNSATGLYYVPTYTSIAYATPATTKFPPTGQTANNPTITINGSPFNPQSPQAAPNGNVVALPIGPVSGLPGAQAIPNTSPQMYAVPVAPPVPTVADVAKVNAQALALMQQLPGFGQSFVWQYYHLVGVQAIPTNDETSKDFYLANIVVESSQPGIQLFRGFPPIPPPPASPALTNIRNQVNVIDRHGSPAGMTLGGGCQGCHGIAQTQQGFDFSFLFFGVAGNGFAPDAIGLPQTPAALAKQLVKRKYLK